MPSGSSSGRACPLTGRHCRGQLVRTAIRISSCPHAALNAKIQKATAQKKTVRLFDGRGLYLEIAPTGSRWWRFKYRFAGKEKRISIGVYRTSD